MYGTQQTPGRYEAILNAIKKGTSSSTPIIGLEQSIEALPDEEVGALFFYLTDYFNEQLRETGEDECKRANVKHLYRRLFGLRYSCLFLTNVAVRGLAREQSNAGATA